jgi:hypothetical protein
MVSRRGQIFQSLFKANSRATIAIVIRLSSYFPRFVNPKDNQALMVEVCKEELLRTLQSFQKYKSPGLDGLLVEFSWVVMNLLKNIYEEWLRLQEPLGKIWKPLIQLS